LDGHLLSHRRQGDSSEKNQEKELLHIFNFSYYNHQSVCKVTKLFKINHAKCIIICIFADKMLETGK
jgi:hypothetical protein